MHRISTDSDYLKTGKVVIDADGVPVDVPDRAQMEAADTALGQRIDGKADRSAMDAADTALGQRIDTEKWMRGNVPSSATSINDLAPGLWAVADVAVATTLNLPEATAGFLEVRKPLNHTVAVFTGMSTANRIRDSWIAHADASGNWGPWEPNKFATVKPLWSSTPVENLPTGLHKVQSSSVAATLGLPVSTTGSLLVHNFGAETASMIWQPTTIADVWVRRKHGTTWGAWTLASYVNRTPLSGATAVEDLATGLYSVGNGTVATTLNLPAPGSGSLWVHTPRSDLGRMEWRPTASLDVYHRRKHGTSWGAWEQFGGSGGGAPAEHDHDDRYYTKSEVDRIADPGLSGEITGVSLTLEDTGNTMYVHSIGVDGWVYGVNSSMLNPQRSGDGLVTWESGPRFSNIAGPGAGVVHSERTSEGFIVIWKVDNLNHTVWFSENFQGPYTKVLDMGTWAPTSKVKSRLIAGTTWMMIAEYSNAIAPPTFPMKRFLSTDGGKTFTMVRETTADDTSTNSHHHTGLITSYGRIYSSEGDGPANRWFGYSDDRGKSWVPVPVDETLPGNHPWYSQPTMMIDFGDTIFTSPDAGPVPSSMWRMDPHTHRQEMVWELTHGGPYTDASKQYGRSQYAQAGYTGQEAYVMFPDGGSGNRTTYVAATPDGGQRWGIVAVIDTSTGVLNSGVTGPDRNGYIYMRGAVAPVYGSNVIRAKTIDWRQIDY